MRKILEIIKDGNIEELKTAIKSKINVNEIYTDYDNETPIFYSNYEQTKILIEAGAKVNHVNKYLQNALFFLNNSFTHGEKDTIEKKFNLLINNNINVHQLDIFRNNFLSSNNINIESIKIYEKSGVDLKNIDSDGENLFFSLNDFYKVKEIREYLQEKGVDLFQENKYGENILFKTENKELLKYYLNKGFDINKKNNLGLTILMEYKSEDFKIYLIENNIDINIVSKENKNALDYNCYSEKIVKKLLEKNIKILQPPSFYEGDPVCSKLIEEKRMEYLRLKIENEKNKIISTLDKIEINKNLPHKKRI